MQMKYIKLSVLLVFVSYIFSGCATCSKLSLLIENIDFDKQTFTIKNESSTDIQYSARCKESPFISIQIQINGEWYDYLTVDCGTKANNYLIKRGETLNCNFPSLKKVFYGEVNQQIICSRIMFIFKCNNNDNVAYSLPFNLRMSKQSAKAVPSPVDVQIVPEPQNGGEK